MPELPSAVLTPEVLDAAAVVLVIRADASATWFVEDTVNRATLAAYLHDMADRLAPEDPPAGVPSPV